jgi:hypothetical protein
VFVLDGRRVHTLLSPLLACLVQQSLLQAAARRGSLLTTAAITPRHFWLYSPEQRTLRCLVWISV